MSKHILGVDAPIRIRISGDRQNVVWSYSKDSGTTWIEAHRYAATFDIGNAFKTQLIVGNLVPGNPATTDAYFDNFRHAQVVDAKPHWSDDFTTLNLDKWSRTTTAVTAASGKLQIPVGKPFIGIGSRTGSPLAGNSYEVDILSSMTHNGQSFLSVEVNESNRYMFLLSNNGIELRTFENGINDWKSIDYAVGVNEEVRAPIKIRISGDGGYVVWSYSKDSGKTWTEARRYEAQISLTQDFGTILSSGYWGNDAIPRDGEPSPPITALFDNFRRSQTADARLYATSTGDLATYLSMTVERGHGGGNGSCTGFVSEDPPKFVYNDIPFTSLPDAYDDSIVKWKPAGLSQKATFRFTGSTNDPAGAAGKTATTTFKIGTN